MPRKTIAGSRKKKQIKKTNSKKGKTSRYLVNAVIKEIEERNIPLHKVLTTRPMTVTLELVRTVYSEGHLDNKF